MFQVLCRLILCKGEGRSLPYFQPDGTKWSGNRVLAIDWDTAEYIASLSGEIVTGKLVMEVDCNESGIQWDTVKEY